MLWSICFFNYADRQAIFSVFPLLEKEMHLSPVQLGLLGSAFAWIYGLGSPLAGIIVDRVRRKTVILGGLHVWSAICVATALSGSFAHLLLFRAAEGLGETFYYPGAVSLISDYHGKATRSRALGLLVTSVYMGTIGGGFFAGLIGQRYGWRSSFIVFGGMGILLGLALQRFLREPARGATDDAETFAVTANQNPRRIGPLDTLRMIARVRPAVTMTGAFVCATFVAGVLHSWMPKYFHDKFGMSLAMAGLSATLFSQLSSLAGAFTGGWLADTLVKRTNRGRLIVQMIGVFGGAPFVMLCGMTHSIGWIVLALTGWGFFKGLYDANIFASAFDVIPPEARGTAVGVMNCIAYLAGGGPAPVIIGLIAQRWNLGLAIAAASVVYIASGMLLLVSMYFPEYDNVPNRVQPSGVATA